MKYFFLFLFTIFYAFGNEPIISFYAVNLDTGEVVADQNSNLNMIPASCLKIVITSAALQMLNKPFETHLEYDGHIERGILYGNLYIKGGGDPCLGLKQLPIWHDAIEKLGIQEIKGKVIGDDSHWEKGRSLPSWNWEDLGNYYGASPSALSFNENEYLLFFKPGNQIGDVADITHTQPPVDLIFQNEVKTGPEGSGDCACIFGSELSPIRSVRGTIPLGVDFFTIRGSVPDPATWCADLLKQQLQVRNENYPESKRIIFHTTYSPSIADIVYRTNQKSVNLYAEHLLKAMGGVKAVTDFWKGRGIDLTKSSIVDGAGLSRKNLITAKQLVDILVQMKQSPAFVASLPQIDAHTRAKSGSMSFIRCYVGYKDNVAFAIMVNHCTDKLSMNDLRLLIPSI